MRDRSDFEARRGFGRGPRREEPDEDPTGAATRAMKRAPRAVLEFPAKRERRPDARLLGTAAERGWGTVGHGPARVEHHAERYGAVRRDGKTGTSGKLVGEDPSAGVSQLPDVQALISDLGREGRSSEMLQTIDSLLANPTNMQEALKRPDWLPIVRSYEKRKRGGAPAEDTGRKETI